MEYRYYEIAAPEDGPSLTVGRTGLKEIRLSKEQEEAVIAEAKQWTLIRDIDGYEILYWHDNDRVDHSSISRILGFYHGGTVVKDGHYYGTLIDAQDTASMGLSVTRWPDVGLVCIDGFHDGKTTEYESHGSDEVYWQHNVTYYLKKNEE